MPLKAHYIGTESEGNRKRYGAKRQHYGRGLAGQGEKFKHIRARGHAIVHRIGCIVRGTPAVSIIIAL